MQEQNLSELTDKELLEHKKKMKSSAWTNAFLIGFLMGIILFSVAKSTWGFLTLIPLYLIYRLTRKSTSNEALKEELEKRGLDK